MSGYLELWRLTKRYPVSSGDGRSGETQTVVKNFSLSIEKGEVVALIGHSGCGKSTVLSIVAGLTPSSGGGIILDDREVSGPGTDRGMVFQSPCLLPWLTALENVALAVDQVAREVPRPKRRSIAADHLEQVGLGDSLDRRPDELSAGMRQRVGIARALALSPKVLLLDEPFGMLDSLTRIELQDLLLRLWAREKKTTFLVTHDVDEAIFLSDRVVMMTDGPEAGVGKILAIPLPRPRDRRAVFEDPLFDALRRETLGFLEDEASRKAGSAEPEPPGSSCAEDSPRRATFGPSHPTALVGSGAGSGLGSWSKP